MMDLQAAIGLHQLKKIGKNRNRRAAIWEMYNQAFSDLPVTIPSLPEPDTVHAYHLYTILINENETGISRDQFLLKMTENNIGIGVHYLSIPEHPYYQSKFGWKPEDFPNARYVGRHTVSLPLSPKLTDEDVGDVVAAVKRALN